MFEWILALNFYELVLFVFSSAFATLGIGYGTTKAIPAIANKMTDIEMKKKKSEITDKYPIPMNLNDFTNRLRDLKNHGNLSNKEYKYINNLFTNDKEYKNLIKIMNNKTDSLNYEFINALTNKTLAKMIANSTYSGIKNRNKEQRTQSMNNILESLFNDDSMVFFGIIVLNFSTYVRKDNYGNSLKFCHRSHNEFCDNCTFLLTDIDFNNHKEEYYTLIQFDEKINELKKDLNEYIETNKNPDKEVVSLMESKITEGYKAGYSILDQIKGISSIESEQKNSEKTIELFEKTHMTNFDY